MQPLEPFLHMLDLRGAFLAVPSCGTPDWLRVSLELEHDGASLAHGVQTRSVQNSTVFDTAHASTCWYVFDVFSRAGSAAPISVPAGHQNSCPADHAAQIEFRDLTPVGQHR